MKYVLVSSFLVLFFHIVLLCVVVGFFYYFLVVFFSLFLTIILFKTLFVGQPSILLRWCYFNHHILRSLYKFESRIQNFRKISFCHIKFYFLFSTLKQVCSIALLVAAMSISCRALQQQS